MALVAPWLTEEELPATRPALPSDESWATLCGIASEILYALSGRRWGGSTSRTVELDEPPRRGWLLRDPPIRDDWLGGSLGGSLLEAAYDDIALGGAYSSAAPWGGSAWAADARWVPGLRLPDYPVTGIVSVTMPDGTLADPADYRLAGRRYLEHHHRGFRGWPACGGIVVSYTCGEPPPQGGVEAAKALTLQLGLAAAGSDECALPGNVTQIVRQGTTMTLESMSSLIAAGRTGVYLTDLWVRSVNPDGRRRRSRSWSPDVEPRSYPAPQPPPP